MTFTASLYISQQEAALLGSWLGAKRISNADLRRALGLVMFFAVANFW